MTCKPLNVALRLPTILVEPDAGRYVGVVFISATGANTSVPVWAPTVDSALTVKPPPTVGVRLGLQSRFKTAHERLPKSTSLSG